jgi:hypothetical protein
MESLLWIGGLVIALFYGQLLREAFRVIQDD